MSRRIVMEAHAMPAGESVLDELGLDASDVVKAKLAIRIQKSIAEMGLGKTVTGENRDSHHFPGSTRSREGREEAGSRF